MTQSQVNTLRCNPPIVSPEAGLAKIAPHEAYTPLRAALPSLEERLGRSYQPQAILTACRAFVVLGLNGPARDLLKLLSLQDSERPEVTSLRQALSKAPSGRVGWSSLQHNFDRNVQLLFERFPQLRCCEKTFRSIPRSYELYRSVDGNWHLSTLASDGVRKWLTEFTDAKGIAQNAKLPHNPKALFCGPYLISGDRFGLLLQRVFNETSKMFLTFTPRIYVIEPNETFLGVALFILDSVESLCHERVMIFTGSQWDEQLATWFGRRPRISPPEYAVRLGEAGVATCEQAIEALRPRNEAIERYSVNVIAQTRARYGSRTIADWARRFQQCRDHGKSLRVLGLTSRFTTYLQYSIRDWAAAFESKGHPFLIHIEENDHDLLPPLCMAEAVHKFEPDLIVCIDHFRHEYAHVLPDNVPFVGWIQDALPHLYDRKCGESLRRLDYYIARDAGGLAGRFGYPESRGVTWPMVTNEQTFSCEPMAEHDLAPYRCDFSFVSSHSKLPETSHQERRAQFSNNPVLIRYIDALFDRLRHEHSTGCSRVTAAAGRLVDETAKQLGMTFTPENRTSLLISYVYPMNELFFRQATLEWVADYCDRAGRTLHLYGNGWENHPRFDKYARGFACNGPELRAIYQASKINLQITTFGAIHQRLLDGLAAGGFFLICRTSADTSHILANQLLTAIRNCDVHAGQSLALGQHPELDNAMRQLWAHYGYPEPTDRYEIPTDSITQYEELERTGYDQIAGAVFEEYPRVVFDSPDQLCQQAEVFLSSKEKRDSIALSMRAKVCRHYTYNSLVDHLLTFIAADLNSA